MTAPGAETFVVTHRDGGRDTPERNRTYLNAKLNRSEGGSVSDAPSTASAYLRRLT
ncbi:hypothetical protein H4W34_000298 [Actinomadura algeriensis]|uniref:Uncharacterized protein n=1 Tax=Actinomadura algeriensis TaxID=1679523 RepID=A0ABR9JIT4_9ACTN|nr:hypothetical protein [Actinomadura algeriensis]